MTEYEKQEIEKYPEIWYLGLESCKINGKAGAALNCGYDDDNGSYNKVNILDFILNSIFKGALKLLLKKKCICIENKVYITLSYQH